MKYWIIVLQITETEISKNKSVNLRLNDEADKYKLELDNLRTQLNNSKVENLRLKKEKKALNNELNQQKEKVKRQKTKLKGILAFAVDSDS